MSRLMNIAAVCITAVFSSACTSLSVREDAFFWPETRVIEENLSLPVDPPPVSAENFVLGYAQGDVAAARVRSEARGFLILYCGGNTFRLRSGGGSAARKTSSFGDVLLFDYPGYGDTAGPATIANFQAVGRAMAAMARRRADAEGLILIAWGHSLGGAVCAEAARVAAAEVLVLEATPPGARALVDTRLGSLRPFVRVDTDPALAAYDIPRLLSGYRGKVVVLEASRDKTLPPALSRRLVAALRGQGQQVEHLPFPKADHGSIGEQSDFRARLAATLQNQRSVDDPQE